MKGNYHVIDGKEKGAERTLAAFCKANGQILLPLVELVEQARLALDTVVEQVSQQTIETILQLSAEQIAGARTPGRSSGEIRWYGNQAGRVSLADRQLSVRKPRLRRRETGRGGEVGVPAYQALQKNPAMGTRMFEALLRGVSTRQYREVLPRMAETVGVSKSSISEKSNRSEHGTARRTAGKEMGGNRATSDLHRWDAIRNAPRDQRGGRRCAGRQTCAGDPTRSDGEHGGR